MRSLPKCVRFNYSDVIYHFLMGGLVLWSHCKQVWSGKPCCSQPYPRHKAQAISLERAITDCKGKLYRDTARVAWFCEHREFCEQRMSMFLQVQYVSYTLSRRIGCWKPVSLMQSSALLQSCHSHLSCNTSRREENKEKVRAAENSQLL